MDADCPDCKAISMLSPSGQCYIGIDYRAVRTEKDERQYLAHDIGHCVKGAFYNPYSDFDCISQKEYRADAAATRFLVPQLDLEIALQTGNTELWQLCEYFEVDEKYIRLAFWIYFDRII